MENETTMLTIEVPDEDVHISEHSKALEKVADTKNTSLRYTLTYSISFFSRHIGKGQWGIYSTQDVKEPIQVEDSQMKAVKSAIEINAACAAVFMLEEVEKMLEAEVQIQASEGAYAKTIAEGISKNVIEKLRTILKDELTNEQILNVKGSN